MTLFSPVKLFAFAAFIVLALVGFGFYLAARQGWKRNGYFRLPAVVLIVLGLFITFQALGNGITMATIGIHIEGHPVIALTINGLAEIAIMLVGTVLISHASRQNLLAVFRLEGLRETPALPYVLALPIILVAQAAGSALSAIWERGWKYFPDLFHAVNQYESASDTAMQGLVTATGPLDLALILLFVAIVPALAEETLFRGFAQSNIERSGRWHARPVTALVTASFLFALVHASLFKLPGLFALGMVLGWMTYRTNNLFVGAIGHAINNGFIVAVLYLNPNLSNSASTSLVGTEELSATDALRMLALIIPLLGLLLYFFARVTAALQARGNAEREIQSELWQTGPSDRALPPSFHTNEPYE